MPFELAAPDLQRWRVGNTGVEGVWRFAAAAPGPHVAITALVHGNELCGAWAVAGVLALLHRGVALQRGTLTLALCNLAAFDRFDAARPDASRFVDEDMNRLWSPAHVAGAADDASRERRRVAELWPWLQPADVLLDLHSMHEPGTPLLLSGPLPRHIGLVHELGLGGHVVVDAGHAQGPRLRDSGRFGDPASPARALLVECGFHGDPHSRRVAEDAVARLLRSSGLVAARELPARWWLDAPPARWRLDVTDALAARSEDFRFAAAFANLQCLPQRGTPIGSDGAETFTTPYDDCVLVMPSLRQLRPGVTVVRLARRRPL